MYPVTKSPIFKCPCCGKNNFVLAKLALSNTGFMPSVIKCKECDVVIGAVPAAEVIEHLRNFPDDNAP